MGKSRESLGGKLAGKTLRNYADGLEGFCNWCVTRSYLTENPLKGLATFDTTPKTTRRALTIEEIKALFEHAPEERRLLYGVAFCSGLRAGELRALSVQDLDTVNNRLRLHGEWTKNRKAGFQPLPVGLVETLKEFAATGTSKRLYAKYGNRKDACRDIPENPLLYVPSHASRELDKDLEAAGIQKSTQDGKVAHPVLAYLG